MANLVCLCFILTSFLLHLVNNIETSFLFLLFVGCFLFSEAFGISPCAIHIGGSCEQCLMNVSCLWCYSNNTCVDYPMRTLLPSTNIFVGGIILLSVIVCCYCCGYEEIMAKRREERKQRAEEKKAERII
uniref:Pituitary tumor-transforming gene 1 protein-interacting protein n=1 Tax=Erpetoichthys calabaricus TaxID=27687 RepID=A0A8C4T9T6_ERPCA